MRREIHSNHRLVVTPGILTGNHNVTRAMLDSMAAQVRRHVDHVGAVTVRWDTKAVCSHCGYEWETVTAEDIAANPADYEGAIVGEPVCCAAAVAEFHVEQGQTGGES